MPMSKDGNAEMVILPVPLTLLSAISTLRVSIPNDLRPPDAKRATLLTLKVRLATLHACQLLHQVVCTPYGCAHITVALALQVLKVHFCVLFLHGNVQLCKQTSHICTVHSAVG